VTSVWHRRFSGLRASAEPVSDTPSFGDPNRGFPLPHMVYAVRAVNVWISSYSGSGQAPAAGMGSVQRLVGQISVDRS